MTMAMAARQAKTQAPVYKKPVLDTPAPRAVAPVSTNTGVLQRKSCACGGGCPTCQAKSSDLKVSQPNDAVEIETDRVADKVMRMQIDEAKPNENMLDPPDQIHRKSSSCEVKAVKDKIQGEGEILPFVGGIPSQSPAHVQNAIDSDGQPIEHQTCSFFESRFRYDFSSVRVHTNAKAEQSSKAIKALAYTVGRNIVFGKNQYRPESEAGKFLIGHELAHVIQQGEGRVQPNTELQGQAVNNDPGLESEANDMGRKAAQMKTSTSGEEPKQLKTNINQTIQRTPEEDAAAANEALDRQVDIHDHVARERIANARAEGASLLALANATGAQMVDASQQALQEVATWRRFVDQRALAQVETSYSGIILGVLKDVADDVIGALADSNPIAKGVYYAIKYAITLGMAAADAAPQVSENQRLIGASATSQALSIQTSDSIISQIFGTQGTAVSVFNHNYGQLLAQTSPESGSAASVAGSQVDRERGQMEDRPSEQAPERDDIQDAESAGIGITEVADRAEAYLGQLRQALQTLQNAASTIRERALESLVRTQILFANGNGDGPINLDGNLIFGVREGPTLQLSTRIGSDARQTELNEYATLGTFAGMGRTVRINLVVQRLEEVLRIFALPDMAFIDRGNIVCEMNRANQLDISGMTDFELGMFMAHSWWRYAGIGSDDVTPEQRTAAVAFGQQMKQQMRVSMLHSTLGDLRDTQI